MLRYSLKHPKTVTVNFETFQRVGDYLFNFRNLPDFEQYTICDNESQIVYKVTNEAIINGLEFTQI